MAFARARAVRTLQSSFRRSIPRVSAPGRTQLVQRRWASGGGHGHEEPSSDLPWALAGLIVTVPSCWYLWPDSSSHGHHDEHGDEHGEEHAEGGDEKGEEETAPEPAEEEPKDEESGPVEDAKPDTEQEQQKEEKKDEEVVEAEEEKKKDKKEEGESQPAEGEGEGEGEGKKFVRDKTTMKTLPSSGQNLGKGDTPNTKAKHSMPIGDSPEKSKKPEGGPETAKASGTVAVKRHD